MTDTKDDTDFNDSNNDLSTGKVDRLCDDNVTEEIEVGCDEKATEREEDDVAIQNEY